jgi:hypothetical protein
MPYEHIVYRGLDCLSFIDLLFSNYTSLLMLVPRYIKHLIKNAISQVLCLLMSYAVLVSMYNLPSECTKTNPFRMHVIPEDPLPMSWYCVPQCTV